MNIPGRQHWSCKAVLIATATLALCVPAAPAAAQEAHGLTCRMEIPMRVDDRGHPEAAGVGTSACTGRLGQSFIAGEGTGTIERLTLAPAAGGGLAIRTARLRAKLPGRSAPWHATRHTVRVDLAGAFGTGTAAAQPLTGHAVDDRAHSLSIVGASAWAKDSQRPRADYRLIMTLSLRDAFPPPPPDLLAGAGNPARAGGR